MKPLNYLEFARPSIIAFFAMFILGCVHYSPAERSLNIANLAIAQGWEVKTINSGVFELRAIVNNAISKDQILTVYIEGDGYAWVDGGFPSDDPTPYNPVALMLSMAQPTGAVAYLGRPCQYLGAATNVACAKNIWTNERYSELVIESINQSLSILKAQNGASKIRLVGYSGGGTIALIVGARRSDVIKLITVAGNLDPEAWVRHFNLEPLKGSLSPINAILKNQMIPQVDFVGGRDQIVPPQLTEDFVLRYPPTNRPIVIKITDNNHVCCWVEQWPKLSKEAFQ